MCPPRSPRCAHAARSARAALCALCAALLCCAPLSAQLRADTGQNTTARIQPSANESELIVAAAVAGDGAAGAALAALAAAVLQRAGLRARTVPPPPACRAPSAPDGRACRDATLAELAAANLHTALLPVPAAAAPAAWLLRDYGLIEFGDAAPPARRVCSLLAAPPARAPHARSLLDLADADVARQHHVTPHQLDAALSSLNLSQNFAEMYEPPWCSASNGTCALALTSSRSEAAVLLAAALRFQLRLRALPLGRRLDSAPAALATASPLLCDWAPEWSALSALLTPSATRLGPPPCSFNYKQDSSTDCPFESLRLMKFANVRALARSPTAIRALIRLRLDSREMRDLAAAARGGGEPDVVAREFLEAHPKRQRRAEVRVVVMIPNVTTRETYDAPALAAAAELLEADLEAAGIPRAARFKVELYDDRCDVRQAYKYMFNALGTGEYSALSAMAGPACAGPFAEVAHQSPAHAMPLLAYSAQAAPSGAAALLAAGDTRDYAAALTALAQRLHWTRLAALSEPATRIALDASRLHVPVDVHVEVPDPLPDDGGQIFEEWAQRVSAAGAPGGGRVVLLAAEDARVVRAALCAGLRAGLSARAGTAWLLPATLPAGWLRAAPADRPGCSQRELDEAADGHLSFAPEWLAAWRNETQDLPPDPKSCFPFTRRPTLPLQNISEWRKRWRSRCALWARRVGGAVGAAGAGMRCAGAAPLSALLYDALRLWAGALDRLLDANPDRFVDFHDLDTIRNLVENALEAEYVGLTGRFEWAREGTGAVRVAPLVLLQWENGTRRAVGRWRRGGALRLGAPRWRTQDGAPPGDGTERCALRPLAELLRADCRAAGVALAALLLVLGMTALAAAALHCKRRAEREYRARLAALSLRALPALPAKRDGLDRWEVSRERVVINRKLGMGAFGTVYGGHALLSEERGWTAVAVKTLKAGTTTEEKLDFLSEAEAMKRFDHKNIVRLLGVVTKTEPVCTVMEFMLYGDLKNYLLARRHLALARAGSETDADAEADGHADEVSARRLTSMARDAARALAYLARLRYVHRDVAARNCLVSARRVLKLADFGMTRLVFENDYYRFSRKGMLPVRWMAPESLALGVFSPASDVWSFGVLLYEIVSFGSLPFQGLSNAEVLARVKAGHTLDLPPGLVPQLEELMTSCWRRERSARPSACELAARLADAPRLLEPCLDVPLDALPLHPEPPWHAPPDRAAARWLSWAAPAPPAAPASAPASAHTDTTYLSAEPRDTDHFLPC